MVSNQIISQIENSSLQEALVLVANLFPGQTYFSTSLGQEDQLLTHAIYKAKCDIKTFTLDTGRLFYETYDLLAKTNFRYGQLVKVCFPNADDVEQYVNQKGINAFYESVENRKECCHIRKVKPLNIALKNAKVWITGLRAEQSANRHTMKMFEWDGERNLFKFNPLIHWSLDEVIVYLKEFDVPYNPLHDKGFVSIGCACCTRAVEPGEDPRAGRWWWEDANKKECGLHVHENKISQN